MDYWYWYLDTVGCNASSSSSVHFLVIVISNIARRRYRAAVVNIGELHLPGVAVLWCIVDDTRKNIKNYSDSELYKYAYATICNCEINMQHCLKVTNQSYVLPVHTIILPEARQLPKQL